MKTLRQEIGAGLADGTFRSRLEADCLAWREHRSPYAIANVVWHAAGAGLADGLYDALADGEFRDLRRSGFGVNALREDLQTGLDFFGHEDHLDLLRYIQVLFLEQRDADAAALDAHRRHCREFTDFMQLDVPPQDRRDLGVHRVLGRLFPMSLEARTDPGQETPQVVATVRLAGYEVGSWQCSCGACAGQARRYDYACPCGGVRGNGRLGPEPPPCPACGRPPAYATCAACGTRVTLALFWSFRAGNLHPSAFRLPVTADLVVQRPGGPEEAQRLVLIQLPLMLGVREKNGVIVAEPPDVFWVGGEDSDFAPPWSSGQLISLRDAPHYDRQAELRKILESALRRTFTERISSRSLRSKLRTLVEGGWKKAEAVEVGFTRAFERRLGRRIAAADVRGGELIKLVDLSRDCVVAASPRLRRTMVWVNRRLLRPGAFMAPCLTTLDVVLREGKRGSDALTPTPPGRARGEDLGEDGIVLPGRTVQPGDVLVGIQSPKGSDELTPEDKLFHALFGRDLANWKDASREYEGATPGRVLSVHVRLGRRWKGVEVRPGPGKFVSGGEELPRGELARIAVTLAVTQPLEVGDSLHGEEGTTAVVCRIVGGPALVKMLDLPTEPDLVVAPDHPWAQPAAGGSAAHTVRVGLAAGTLLAPEVTSRGTGPYDLISQRPFRSEWTACPAQALTAADFRWLLDRGARHLALELYGPRCDCVEWRPELYRILAKGERRLADLSPASVVGWCSPGESPSEGVRHWDQLLRAACIQPFLEGGRLSFRLMTARDVLAGSFGEVKKPETINYRTHRPEKDGLFCERIFGPEKDWECACGKYRGMKYKEMTCDRCGVLVTHSRIRRKRTGHIELAAPVVHSWFFRGAACLLGEALGMDPESLDQVIHHQRDVVIEPGASPLRVGQTLDEEECRRAAGQYGEGGLRTDTGAEAVEALLERAAAASGKEDPLARAVLRRLPILPPDFRPLVLLDSGTFATSDLNDLYRRIINRNNRLRKLRDLNAPEVIIRNEKRTLQRDVEALLDNDRCPKPVVGSSHRPLVPVAGFLRRLAEEDGTLREGFLHRPADYSARTRLAVDDTPDVDTCLLPERLAWDLYYPLVIARLKATGEADTIKSAKKLIGRRTEGACAAFGAVCAGAVVLASPAGGPCRLLALRVRPTGELALKVHPELLDRVGWDNLGRRVNLFAVLTAEAEDEAVERLLPSRLFAQDARDTQGEAPPSAFDVGEANLIDELARWASTGRSFPLTQGDHLLLCVRELLDPPPQPGG
jgi:hypothetical protein